MCWGGIGATQRVHTAWQWIWFQRSCTRAMLSSVLWARPPMCHLVLPLLLPHQEVMRHFQLRERVGAAPQSYGLGLKEVWEVSGRQGGRAGCLQAGRSLE